MAHHEAGVDMSSLSDVLLGELYLHELIALLLQGLSAYLKSPSHRGRRRHGVITLKVADSDLPGECSLVNVFSERAGRAIAIIFVSMGL